MREPDWIVDIEDRWKRPVRRLALTACAVLAIASPANAQPQGNDYYRARSTAEMSTLLGNVEKFHIGPGLEKMQQGSHYYAYQDFEFVLRYFPNHPRGLALISELCDVRWKDARCDSDAWFRKALEVNPNAPQTYLVNGVHEHRLSRYPEAIESYKRAIVLDPRSGNAHYNLGLVYFEQKQFEPANRHAQIAYALGMPFPALRDRLTQAGQWKPLEPGELQRELAASEKSP